MKTTAKSEQIALATLAVGFIVWVYLFRDFFLGRIGLFPDGRAYFDWIKFYFDSMSNGEYPLWHPFQNWGYPIGFKIRFIGEFNPFLLLAYLPYRLGLPYPLAYFGYAVFYFAIGVWGLFCLVDKFLKDRQMAYSAGALMLFSSTGLAIFINYCELLLLVPGIWFFYFLLAFTRSQEKRYLLGMTFCLMNIMTTYMPFYFLVVLIFFLISYAILFPKQTKGHLHDYARFARRHKAVACLCLFAVIVSALPGVFWYLEANSGQMTYPHRQGGAGVENIAVAGERMVNVGGIAGLVIFKKLFSGLGHQGNALGFFFLSVFAYPVILTAAFLRFNKRLVLLLVLWFLLLLFSLTDITMFHPFLHEHVFFIKLMRNIYYMFYLALPVLILVVVEQLRMILARGPRTAKHRWGGVLFLSLVHGIFLLFLYQLDSVVVTSYLTVIGSFLFFSCLWLEKLSRESKMFMPILLLLIALQPAEVFYHYTKLHKNESHSSLYNAVRFRRKPVFFYRRPKLDESTNRPPEAMRESSGFIQNKKYAGSKDSYLLHENVSHALLQEYTQYKWIAYDDLALVRDGQWGWSKLGLDLARHNNVAYVLDGGLVHRAGVELRKWSSKAEVLTADSPNFEVLDFGLNSIKVKTNFKEPKFLVYNDSFNKGWRAFIDGKPARIYRANVAFKGLFVEPGEKVIDMRYRSWIVEAFYFGLLAFFYGFFIYFLIQFFRPVRHV